MPQYVEGHYFITLVRRDGERFTGTIPDMAGSLELVVSLMDLLWQNNPAAARAILDHLNAAKPVFA